MLLERGSGLQDAHFSPELATLWGQLADVSGEREITRSAFDRTKAALIAYREELRNLATAPLGLSAAVLSDAAWGSSFSTSRMQQAHDLAKTLDSAVQGLGSVATTTTPKQSALDPFGYNLCELGAHAHIVQPENCIDLHKSLEDTQRRCEELNRNQLKDAEENEEWIESLGAVRAINRRLLEQIHFQTDEIAQLTQQRISDEERTDALTRRHEIDHDAMQQEKFRKVCAIQKESQAKVNTVRQRLADGLTSFRARLQVVCQDTARAREEQCRLRAESSALFEGVIARLADLAHEIQGRCALVAQVCLRDEAAVEECVHKLEVVTKVEQGERCSEALSWGRRLDLLAGDLEDTQRRSTRDARRLSSTVEVAERLLAAERQERVEERIRLEKCQSEFTHDRTCSVREVEEVQISFRRVEAAIEDAHADIHAKTQSIAELQQHLADSREALACATSGNQHAREQVEQQLEALQAQSQAGLERTETEAGMFLQGVVEMHRKQAHAPEEHLKKAERRAEEYDIALQDLLVQIDAVTTECEALQQNIAALISQHDISSSARLDLERDFAEAQQRATVEKLHMQSEGEKLKSEIQEIEASIKSFEEQCAELNRAAAAKEIERAARQRAAEHALQELRKELADLQRQKGEAEQVRKQAELQAAEGQRRVVEEQTGLERRMAMRRTAAAEEQRGLMHALASEREATVRAQQALDHERELGPITLREARDESLAKLREAEQSKAAVEASCHSMTTDAEQVVGELRQFCNGLERKLVRLRCSIVENETSLSLSMQEIGQDDQDISSLRKLEVDVSAARRTREQVAEEEVSITRQIQEIAQEQDEEQARLTQELEYIRCQTMRQTSVLQDQWQQAKAEQDRSLSSNIDRSRNYSTITVGWSHEEVAQGEHDSFRSTLTHQGRGSVGLTKLHSKLEGHIQRLQRHTDQLRNSLQSTHGTSPAAAAQTALNSVVDVPVLRRVQSVGGVLSRTA